MNDIIMNFNEDLLENLCKTMIDYPKFYWLRDMIYYNNTIVPLARNLLIFAYYPNLAVKYMLNLANKAYENYSVNLSTKTMKINYFDTSFAKNVMGMSYPGIMFGLEKTNEKFMANIMEFKIMFDTSLLQAKTILNVFFIILEKEN